MMKVMLAAIEIFSLVYQRIFAQKVLTQRKHGRVWECFVWGMYFVISNFFTYSFAKSAWDNTGIFVVSFFFALRILYIDSAWVLSAVTAFMAISGALSEVLTYYGWQIFVQKSGVKVDTANEDYLLLLVSKLVMFFFIKILLALIKRHKNISHISVIVSFSCARKLCDRLHCFQKWFSAIFRDKILCRIFRFFHTK